MTITKEAFRAATGRGPEADDLQRANCTDAGKFGHMQCGWCETHNGPAWLCACWQQRMRIQTDGGAA